MPAKHWCLHGTAINPDTGNVAEYPELSQCRDGQDTRSDLMFTLVVDDFGVRYTTKASVDRLLQVLRTKYRLKEDWTGSRYCGLHLDWNYAQGYVDISMPGYIERALLRFEHPRCKRPEHAPHRWNAPVYGARQQFDSVDTHDLGRPSIAP